LRRPRAYYGYPQRASGTVTNRAAALAKRWPNSSRLLGASAQFIGVPARLRSEARTGAYIAM
jgi:hypothetical protein